MWDDIISQTIPVIVGCMITGMAWLVKSMIGAKKDIDYAHEKIRDILNKLEKRK